MCNIWNRGRLACVIVIRKSKDEEEKKIALFGCLEERMAPPMGCSSSHGAGSGVAEA
jgi:hypothetical protein